jgi:hypothetical protein
VDVGLGRNRQIHDRPIKKGKKRRLDGKIVVDKKIQILDTWLRQTPRTDSKCSLIDKYLSEPCT